MSQELRERFKINQHDWRWFVDNNRNTFVVFRHLNSLKFQARAGLIPSPFVAVLLASEEPGPLIGGSSLAAASVRLPHLIAQPFRHGPTPVQIASAVALSAQKSA